jgi:signal transduction histidine kinase
MHILHLEDSEHDHQLVQRTLRKAGGHFTLLRVDQLAHFLEAVTKKKFDAILADYKLPGFTALDAWNSFPEDLQRPPFILLSGAIGESAAVQAIQLGMSDYLDKSELHRLERVIQRTVESFNTRLARERADVELALSEKRLAQFSEHLQETIEQERASIAREIHDDIGGSLAAINLDLSWISRNCDSTEIHEHLQAASEMLQHAIGASQRIMMNLRPAVLDQGLFAAAQWLAGGFQRRTGIKTLLHANSEQLRSPKPTLLVAYRTIQEALTNASKYAKCNLVRIDLSDADSVLTVEIRDNGKGLSDADLKKPHSFGIRGLHERAKSVGGWIDVSSRPGDGTSIILTVPLSTFGDARTEDAFL